MSEIIARWSKKSLSQIFFILSGAILVVVCINHFTIVEIKLDFFNIVSVDYTNLKEATIMWIFSILLFNNILFAIVKWLLRIYFLCDIKDWEEKYTKVFIFINTIKDIVDLIVSIYALGIMIIGYQIHDDNEFFMQSRWAIFTYMGVAFRFCDSVYFHFYLQNQIIAEHWLNYIKQAHRYDYVNNK